MGEERVKKHSLGTSLAEVVKTSPSNAVGASSILGQAAEITHASQPKKENIDESIL